MIPEDDPDYEMWLAFHSFGWICDFLGYPELTVQYAGYRELALEEPTTPPVSIETEIRLIEPDED